MQHKTILMLLYTGSNSFHWQQQSIANTFRNQWLKIYCAEQCALVVDFNFSLLLTRAINLRYTFSPQCDHRLSNSHFSRIRGIYEACGIKHVITSAFGRLYLFSLDVTDCCDSWHSLPIRGRILLSNCWKGDGNDLDWQMFGRWMMNAELSRCSLVHLHSIHTWLVNWLMYIQCTRIFSQPLETIRLFCLPSSKINKLCFYLLLRCWTSTNCVGHGSVVSMQLRPTKSANNWWFGYSFSSINYATCLVTPAQDGTWRDGPSIDVSYWLARSRLQAYPSASLAFESGTQTTRPEFESISTDVNVELHIRWFIDIHAR